MGSFHNDYLVHGEAAKHCQPGAHPRCDCPHPMYALAVDLTNGETSRKRFYCRCCLDTLNPDDWRKALVQRGPAPQGEREGFPY